MTSGSLLVLGTSSGAGKTTFVTGLCRLLARQGVSVSPFKAQNMSLNSFVTRQGHEISRAQASQAHAARAEPEVLMNPVLLKPGSDTSSQLVVLGRPVGELDSPASWRAKRDLLDLVVDAYRELARRFDVVICEGAGSPAEINLREHDIVNLGFARAAGVPAILVGDIDRGGVFAAFVGTLGLLDRADRELIGGFVINKFRGDESLLQPAVDKVLALSGRPTLGTLPFTEGINFDAEDSLDQTWVSQASGSMPCDVLEVAIVRLPLASNLTDFDPLMSEPGVAVRFVTRPQELHGADVVIIPGTRSTVADLEWLRAHHFGEALVERSAAHRPILGICGGYQMLGRAIEDRVESRRGSVAGLCLLPVSTRFSDRKTLARPVATFQDGSLVEGYEIHYGQVTRHSGSAFFADEGCRQGSVVGTMWHGFLENDSLRRWFLAEVAIANRKEFVASSISFQAIRDRRADALANLIESHVDLPAILSIMEGPGKYSAPQS